MDDQIEKRVELKAPPSRVWRALTDYREFGEWFRVVITESGFENIPPHRRMEALRMNGSGWEEQTRNIANHVAPKP